MSDSHTNYPVILDVKYPEKTSRVLLIVRTLFGALFVGIPHGFCLFFYAIASMVVAFIAWWAILFTGRYPRGMFEFNVGLMRWVLRVNGYMQMWTDTYPPFTGKP